MQALDKSSKEGFRMRSSLIRRSSGAAEMLRRVVRKAVQASRSLPCAENRGSPLLAVLPRVIFVFSYTAQDTVVAPCIRSLL